MDPYGPSSIDLGASTPTTAYTLSARRRRREQNATDDSGTSEDSANSLIDSQDSFRKGGPGKLPLVPVSAVLEPGIVSPTVSAEIISEAQRLCLQYDINYQLNVCLRHNSGEIPQIPGDVTVLIEANAAENRNNEWINIIANLLDYFHEKDFPGRVEITDPIAVGGRKTFTLGHANPLINEWDGIRPSVLRSLKSSDWVTLVPVRRGYAEANSITTLLITAIDPNTQAWQSTIASIKSLLNSRLLYTVDVELHSTSGLWGSHSPIPRTSDRSNYFPLSIFDKKENNIGGIGCQFANNPTNGTIGGFLKLTNSDGDSETFALTCHHVLVNGPNGAPLPQAINQRGSSQIVGDLSGEYQVMVPSHDDVSKFAAGLKNQLEIRQKMMVTAKPDKVAKLADAIHDLQRKSDMVRDHTRELGKAVATSGFRSVKSGEAHWAMDWALVDITNGRGCSNELWWVEYAPMDFMPYLQTTILHDITECAFLSNSMRIKSPVFKCGQATGVTMGYVNEIKQDSRSLSGWPQDVANQSYVVLSAHENLLVGSAGDSGAWLVDAEGKLLGMVHGGNNNNKTCFVIPIHDLFTDIQNITGMMPSLEL